MKITMTEYPTEVDWYEVKRRALVTVGKEPIKQPNQVWKERILLARHSPIRYIRFSFLLEDIPSWVSVHLCRHVHAQPYVCSQRNDRQTKYDRNAARQDAPVNMIWDMNAEELITVCQKRLCMQAADETREVVQIMRDLVVEKCPEFKIVLVRPCVLNRACYEMNPCGLVRPYKNDV